MVFVWVLTLQVKAQGAVCEKEALLRVKICQKNGDWNAEIENAKDFKMICRKNLQMEILCKNHSLESSQTHFIPSVGTLELIRFKQISGFSSKLMALRI